VSRCLHCNGLTGVTVRRGLCQKCYNTPIRRDYASRPRGLYRYTGWDHLTVCRLVSLFKDGLSDRQIAKALRRSMQAVRKRRQRLGLRVSAARHGKHWQEVAAERKVAP
jgi:hypothetical protein